MKYRPEIDGLRAVAVVPVILFHAGFATFSGGFVGVDIFFVISGYLITGIMLDDMARGDFSMVRFYERRARRILPLLFFVMAACVPFALVWMIPSQFNDFAKSAGTVALFLSNFYFLSQVDYFAPAVDVQPLIHTWSLAVEEQYYLLFPLVMLLCRRASPRRMLAVFVALAIASLALAEYGLRVAPERTFFFTGARLWELMAGSICAVLSRSRGWGRDHNGGHDWLAAAGLGMIAVAVFGYDATTPFPGLFALMPVIGAALIILFARPGQVIGPWLAARPVVAVGLVSYGAYLWHQPLFAFARIQSVAEPGPVLMLALGVVAVGLAALTWRYVEQPFRRGPRKALARRRDLFGASLICGAVFVAFGLGADNTAVFNATRSDKQREMLSFLDYRDSDTFNAGYRFPTCFPGADGTGFADYRPDTCLALDPSRPNVLLLGDSHAAHLWRALSRHLPQVNLLQATASNCRHIAAADKDPACSGLVDLLLTETLPRGGIDAVILSARWTTQDASDIGATLDALGEFVDTIVVIGPTPEYSPAVPAILARISDADDYATALHARLKPELRARNAALAAAAKAGGVPYVDLLDVLCDPTACHALGDEGQPISWDYGHYTLDGASRVVSLMLERDVLTADLLTGRDSSR
ncbi:acyltransferase family protein [Oceaniglobus indicus]|uniref:acyltransferase family protein n=1 Tax=Oceaniglobus indicus TaxID=2047749 RepID=UPI000C19C40D|nr:acyltransferase family protein [Oceaniglobus indicus]